MAWIRLLKGGACAAPACSVFPPPRCPGAANAVECPLDLAPGMTDVVGPRTRASRQTWRNRAGDTTVGFDANRPDLLIGVIGAGAMGRGIAQVAAAGGIRVRLTDAKPGAAQEALKFIDSMLRRAAEKGSMTAEEAKAAVERIQIVDGPADMKPCHVVIEAIVENPEIKQKLFAELEAVVAEDCIIASNTSSLSVTLLANKLQRPGRFA